MPEPRHHELYRCYWLEYRNSYGDVERKELGRLMDQQQDLFGNDEFFRFATTLPGFREFWGTLASRMEHELQRMIKEQEEKGGSDVRDSH